MTNLARVSAAPAPSRGEPRPLRLREHAIAAESLRGHAVPVAHIDLPQDPVGDARRVLLVPAHGAVPDFDAYLAMLAEDPATTPTPTIAWTALLDARREPLAIVLGLGGRGLPRPIGLLINVAVAGLLWWLVEGDHLSIALDPAGASDGPCWQLGPLRDASQLEMVLRQTAIPSLITGHAP